MGEVSSPGAAISENTSLYNFCGFETPPSHKQRDPDAWPDQSTGLSRSRSLDPVESMDIYKRLFGQYTLRAMSDPGDILFAFQGILSILQRTLSTPFLAGLPEAYIHDALLWLETGPHTRRQPPAHSSVEMVFPTWSWAGWDTSAAYDRPPLGQILPEVDWFVVDQSEAMARLAASGTYRQSTHPPLAAGNKNTQPGDLPRELVASLKSRGQLKTLDGLWKRSHLLATWTTVASFMITGESFRYGHLGRDGGRDGSEPHENTKIFDAAGRTAGSVILGQDRKKELRGGNRMFEFMLMSRSSAFGDNTLGYFHRSFPRRPWCDLNVMLVQRTGDTATREAIGVIHEDAWIEAEPLSMFIKLE